MSDKQIAGNLAVAERQQKVIVIEASKKPQELKLRVAAYIRVSSDSEDQLNSFAAQERYYSALISGKESWTLVDIYADRGITGTSAEKREEFQRLLSDCRKGLIDRVLCKSISRFARNTKECLEAIRELKALGIGISFEKEHIDTTKVSGEMLTAIFASMAQAESESISNNTRLGIQMRMKTGSFIPATQPYGYRNIHGKIVIFEPEAQQIRQIFRDYLAGYNTKEIAHRLNQAAPDGLPRRWTYQSISKILRNEKYVGNSIWQKSYLTDTLPKCEKKNYGEREQFYAIGTHPAIIPKGTFEQVQELLTARKNKFFWQRERYTSTIPGFMYCGCCGTRVRKKQIRQKNYYICRTHDEDSQRCPVGSILESDVYAAFCSLYFKLKHYTDQILAALHTSLQTIHSHQMLWSMDIIELNKRISNITSQNQLLAMLKQQGGVDPDIFISRSNELAEQLRAAKQEKERLLDAESDDTIAQTKELMEIIEAGPEFLDEFDAELFGELVDKIIVESNERLRFRLKNGLELTESIERTVR